MPQPASEPFFRLEIARLRRHFSVLSFSATEAISEPYLFDLLVSGDEIDLGSLMFKPAFLSLNGGPQGFHGQIQGATRAHYRPGPACYRLTVGPRLACLDLRYNQRVFQRMSATQIIARVLREHGLKERYRFDLAKECQRRETCFQHNESDLQLVHRLCAEEGIHYHFRHTRRSHQLVFSEGLRSLPRAPIAPWSPSGQTSGVTGFAVTQDADDVPGSRSHQRAQGESDLLSVTAGLLLPLAGHPERDWNHLWLVTQVQHHFDGRATPDHPSQSAYRNRFQAIPWEVGFNPPYTSRHVAGLQRAWIVGPAGQRSDLDASGRVQVQFEWAQPGDRQAACWLPVLPDLNLHCVGGKEVVVAFDKGDLDSPWIIATLHGDSPTSPILQTQDPDQAVAERFKMRLDWQAVMGDGNRLYVDDGSRMCIEQGCHLVFEVGDSQVRFDADGVTVVSPRIVVDTQLPEVDLDTWGDPDDAG